MNPHEGFGAIMISIAGMVMGKRTLAFAECVDRGGQCACPGLIRYAPDIADLSLQDSSVVTTETAMKYSTWAPCSTGICNSPRPCTLETFLPSCDTSQPRCTAQRQLITRIWDTQQIVATAFLIEVLPGHEFTVATALQKVSTSTFPLTTPESEQGHCECMVTQPAPARSRSLKTVESDAVSPMPSEHATAGRLRALAMPGCPADVIVADQSNLCKTRGVNSCGSDCTAEGQVCVPSSAFYEKKFPSLFSKWKKCSAITAQATCSSDVSCAFKDGECGLAATVVEAELLPNQPPIITASIAADACGAKATMAACTGAACTWNTDKAECTGSFMPFADIIGVSTKMKTWASEGEACAAKTTCSGNECKQEPDGSCIPSDAVMTTALADFTEQEAKCDALAQGACNTDKCAWNGECNIREMYGVGLVFTTGKPMYSVIEKAVACSTKTAQADCTGDCEWNSANGGFFGGQLYMGSCAMTSKAAMAIFSPRQAACDEPVIDGGGNKPDLNDGGSTQFASAWIAVTAVLTLYACV